MLRQRPTNFVLNNSHVLARGLVFAGLGRVRGSLRYHDSSPYGRHGTITAANASTGIVFDPTLNRFVFRIGAQADRVDAPVFAVPIGTNSFLISVWVNVNSTSSDAVGVIVSQGDTDAGEWMFRRNNALADIYASSGWTLNTTGIWDTWTHYAITRAGAELRLYQNGIYAARDTTGDFDVNTTKGLQIGGADSVSTRWLVGSIADVMIWVGRSDGLTYTDSTPLIQQLADPSNVMLSGLIQPPKRKYYTLSVPLYTTKRYYKIGKRILRA